MNQATRRERKVWRAYNLVVDAVARQGVDRATAMAVIERCVTFLFTPRGQVVPRWDNVSGGDFRDLGRNDIYACGWRDRDLLAFAGRCLRGYPHLFGVCTASEPYPSGREDSADYSLAVSAEARNARAHQAAWVRSQALADFTRHALSGQSVSRRNHPQIRDVLDAEQRSVLNRLSRPLRVRSNPRSIRRWNDGPDSIPLARDGLVPARHYHDEGGLIQTRVPSFMFREARR